MRRTRFFTDDRGAAAVEFAMIGVALVMLVVGVMEVARVVWVLQTLDRATQETARYRYTSTVTNAELQTTLQAQLTAAGLNDSQAGCSTPTTAHPLIACVQNETFNGDSYISVQAMYLWESMIPFVPTNATLTRTSRVPQ